MPFFQATKMHILVDCVMFPVEVAMDWSRQGKYKSILFSFFFLSVGFAVMGTFHVNVGQPICACSLFALRDNAILYIQHRATRSFIRQKEGYFCVTCFVFVSFLSLDVCAHARKKRLTSFISPYISQRHLEMSSSTRGVDNSLSGNGEGDALVRRKKCSWLSVISFTPCAPPLLYSSRPLTPSPSTAVTLSTW